MIIFHKDNAFFFFFFFLHVDESETSFDKSIICYTLVHGALPKYC